MINVDELQRFHSGFGNRLGAHNARSVARRTSSPILYSGRRFSSFVVSVATLCHVTSRTQREMCEQAGDNQKIEWNGDNICL